MSLLSGVTMAPRDPILGLTEQFNADPNPHKVNLGVGVYFDAAGKLPLLDCVAQAQAQLLGAPKPRGYLPIDGLAAYDLAVQQLVFGAEHPAVSGQRIATVQAIGGTGALKIAADFIQRLNPGGVAMISDPSWENHRALFGAAGFEVRSYPYYDAATRGVRFDAMLAALEAAPSGSVVVLHACCHNPTGCDLTPEQWARVVQVVKAGGLMPLLDMAYQGFGDGIEEDGVAVRLFMDAAMPCFVATSFSKSFSLYGERVGALSAVCADADEAARVRSQLKIVIRTNYSNPPTFGAQLVSTVLTAPALRTLWAQELGAMRERIRAMRLALVQRLQAAGICEDLDYITRQKGMFSYSGLAVAQMQRLRNEFGIYGLDSGRICVAALNEGNLDAVVRGLVGVMAAPAAAPH